jgi:hypothetical protein
MALLQHRVANLFQVQGRHKHQSIAFDTTDRGEILHNSRPEAGNCGHVVSSTVRGAAQGRADPCGNGTEMAPKRPFRHGPQSRNGLRMIKHKRSPGKAYGRLTPYPHWASAGLSVQGWLEHKPLPSGATSGQKLALAPHLMLPQVALAMPDSQYSMHAMRGSCSSPSRTCLALSACHNWPATARYAAPWLVMPPPPLCRSKTPSIFGTFSGALPSVTSALLL